MAVDGQTLEDAGEAFYRALGAFGGASDYGQSATRTFVVTTFKTVAIDIAQRSGALSPEQIATIDSMFYLDPGDLAAIANNVAASPATATQAVEELVELVGEGASTPRGVAPIINAADKLFNASLAIGVTGAAGKAQLTTVMDRLRAAAPADAPASEAPAPVSDASDKVSDAAAGLNPVDCPARLRDGERCYAVTSAVLYQERSRISRVSYGGFAASIRIARGISYRTGNYAVDQTRTPKVEQVATGELCITSQRLVFLSTTKNLDLPFGRLLSCTTEPGLVAVARANAGYLMFDQIEPHAVEVFEQLSGTSPANRQEIEREQNAQYEASLDEPEQPGSHLWRTLATIGGVLVLVAVLWYLFWR